MNIKILLFIFFVGLVSSCSTTYRNGQTPDDVYYSPVRPVDEIDSRTEQKKEEPPTVRRGYMDRQIVMSIHDPRWRNFDDDFDAFYDPYRYGYSCGYYYNPYYYPSPVYITGAQIINPKNTIPRMTNLGSYNYSNMVVVNPKTGSTGLIRSSRPYNNSNSDNNFIRRIIAPTNNTSNSNNNTYRPSDNTTRTYTPSTNSSTNSSSSGSSSSGSSGTSVPRPRRGG